MQLLLVLQEDPAPYTYLWSNGVTTAAITNVTAATYSITITDANGCTASNSVTITEPNITPTITFENFDKTYGDEDFNLIATTNSSGTITYSILGLANGTVLLGSNNQTVTLGNSASIQIRATVAENGLYGDAYKDITLTINKAMLVATANDISRNFGEENPAFTISYSGFKNGDTETVLNVQPIVSSTANSTTLPGEVTIEISEGTDNNYTITTASGTLTIVTPTTEIVTYDASSITVSSVILNGEILSTGGALVNDSGFVYSTTNKTPTLNDSHVGGNVTSGVISEELVNLEASTSYYYRTFITTSEGTTYGDIQIFVTTSIIPATAFTPNGDGINDMWIIPNIEKFPTATVNVYNRYGHSVFSAKGYKNDWQGNYKSNSNILPAGSYYYTIDLGNGSTPLSGWIFINY